MFAKRLSRRSLMTTSAIVGTGAVLAACGATPTPQVIREVVTQVVEKEVTKIVGGTPQIVKETVVVEQTVVVEKMTTPTAITDKVKLIVEWPQYTPAKTRWGEKAFWAYMQAFPNIEIEPMYNTDPNEKLTVAIAGGTPPDIAWHGFGWAAWAQQGVFMALDDIIAERAVDKSVFWEVALTDLSWDGKLYCLPIGITGPTTVAVNLKIYGEAGVDAPVDGNWTYNDLITMGPAMTKPDLKQYACTLSEAYANFWLIGMGGNMGSKDDQWLEMEPQLAEARRHAADVLRSGEQVQDRGAAGRGGRDAYSAALLVRSGRQHVGLHLDGAYLPQ